jgi:hypothetical protein
MDLTFNNGVIIRDRKDTKKIQQEDNVNMEEATGRM